ncbi:MAG: 2OG-Fe(II) oxygenase [Chromatiales bacterium]|nr:2OG-Fe(II) oxygenase [Chromatiales bacterium]
MPALGAAFQVSAAAPSATARAFIRSLDSAAHNVEPFEHWLLDAVLTESDIDDILSLPQAAPAGAVFDGTRECNNQLRWYFSPDHQARHPVCARIAQAFADPQVMQSIEQATGANLANTRARIEYCQDIDGFWLGPHTDISVKRFTMMVYLSDDPLLADAGTSLYDGSPEHRHVSDVPYGRNLGAIFIPGTDTWHGFEKRPIRGVRKSLIVNYVGPEWRAVNELS